MAWESGHQDQGGHLFSQIFKAYNKIFDCDHLVPPSDFILTTIVLSQFIKSPDVNVKSRGYIHLVRTSPVRTSRLLWVISDYIRVLHRNQFIWLRLKAWERKWTELVIPYDILVENQSHAPNRTKSSKHIDYRKSGRAYWAQNILQCAPGAYRESGGLGGTISRQ